MRRPGPRREALEELHRRRLAVRRRARERHTVVAAEAERVDGGAPGDVRDGARIADQHDGVFGGALGDAPSDLDLLLVYVARRARKVLNLPGRARDRQRDTGEREARRRRAQRSDARQRGQPSAAAMRTSASAGM